MPHRTTACPFRPPLPVPTRTRSIAGTAIAAALTLAMPLTAVAQPGSLGSDAGSLGSATGSVGTEAPFTPSAPAPAVTAERVLGGLTIPWDVVQDPDGVVATGERGSGTIHAVHPDGRTARVAADLGGVAAVRESGLMGMALATDFATSRELYTCHSSADHEDNRITAWTASPDWTALHSPRVLVSGIPLADGGLHSGCALLADDAGTVWIGTGDAFSGPVPQDPDSLGGKILRVNRDGSPAEGTIGATPVYSYGHRNVQGLALQPGTGRMFGIEHGPAYDDEVNLLLPGANYGWNPHRGGRYDQDVPMTDTGRFPDAVRATWSSGTPTLAPAGGAFLDHPSWGAWNGALAVAMLKTRQVLLFRLSDDGRSVVDTAVLLRGEHGRLRSITPTPDGSLLVTTSNGNGRDEVIRVRPA